MGEGCKEVQSVNDNVMKPAIHQEDRRIRFPFYDINSMKKGEHKITEINDSETDRVMEISAYII